MILPQSINERCLAGHHHNERWLTTLQDIQPTLIELADGDATVFADLKSQSLHLWTSGEASGRKPPEGNLRREAYIRPSDCTTRANIRNARLPARARVSKGVTR